ncbi:MAG: cellulase family glycosylhydrolase [Gaiella sp.]|uniref:glycoside hydrolase 5 family protein n=1 Tax=Gaiella sp. TaxID=2663207 RepID=UPI003C710A75
MPDPRSSNDRFRLGVNYWPARTAMGWWSDFDRPEVAADFARIAASGLDSVRIFLTWADFQPAPNQVDRRMLDRLIAVADLAAGTGMALIPTLFTGHMSGVNWLPVWALGGSDRDERFRVVSNRRVTGSGLRNWYSDPLIARAHALLATEAAGALAGHDAVWMWDLGNESSNCVIPPTRSSAREWLRQIVSAIRTADPEARVTVGLHMEDLENDRMLGPREASEVCDVLSMHGYPIYARWADGPTDERLLPFLADVTRWLAGGRDLLFAEFGLPTFRRGDPVGDALSLRNASSLVEEQAAAAYTERALAALQRAGCVGAMLWCYSDYESAIWEEPPLDLAVHERSFGLWRADGSAKPSVAVVEAFAGARRLAGPDGYPWIDREREQFLVDPDVELPRLYGLYRTSEQG